MRYLARNVMLTGLTALAIPLGFGASMARAQDGTYGGNPGYSTSSGWSTYPRTTTWGGYYPPTAWGGYYPTTPPPPAGTAWTGYAPATAWGGYTATPNVPQRAYVGGYAPVQTAPTIRYAPATTASSTTARRTPPSLYREHGTGRNVFMHKPWLPNQ